MNMLTRTRSRDIVRPVWSTLNDILCWMSVCLILQTCCVLSAVQYCSINGRKCHVTNCTETGLPELPPFPDVRKWNVTNATIELLEPCLPEIIGPCDSSPCYSGETCTPKGDQYECTCPPGFTDSPNCGPGPPTGIWLYVLIAVLCALLIILAILVVVYCCIRKKNKTCKVHSETDSDQKPVDPSLPCAAEAQGKLWVHKYHNRGGLVLEPMGAPHNHLPSCNASPVPCPNSTNSHSDSSTTPASGGKVITTPHVPDPIESQDSRNRTFSTGSQAGDTSILMPAADIQGTSKPDGKKKKKKKNKKGKKSIELAPIQPKGHQNTACTTAEEV